MTIGRTTTHASLLMRLSEGSDKTAWVEFFDRYSELIRGFARRQHVSPTECDDILQDVLVALTRSMPGFAYDPAKGKFRSYLKTIVLRAIFRRSRQKLGNVPLENVETLVSRQEGDDATEALWETEWRQYHLRLAMRTIAIEFSTADREAFERYGVAGDDARRTADALAISVDQVYQAKSRILRRLESLIDQQVAEEG